MMEQTVEKRRGYYCCLKIMKEESRVITVVEWEEQSRINDMKWHMKF